MSDDLLLEDTPKISKISLKQTGIDGGKKGEEKAPKLDDSSKKASLAECIGISFHGIKHT